MLGSDVGVVQTRGFLGGGIKDALAGCAERQIDRDGKLLAAAWNRLFNSPAHGIASFSGSQEADGQPGIRAQNAQQDVFRLNFGISELGGFVTREKDGLASRLSVPLEHAWVNDSSGHHYN